jgi:hypothetical protein
MRNSGHAAARGGTTADAPGISFTGSNPTAVVRTVKIPRLTLAATSSERAGCGVLLCRLLLARFRPPRAPSAAAGLLAVALPASRALQV